MYTSYAFVSNLLASAAWSQKVTINPFFVIHEFNKLGNKIWIAWTVDTQSHPLTLSVERIDALGNPLADAVLGKSISLDVAPAMIRFAHK